MRTLVAIPVFNEQAHVGSVLRRVLRHAEHVLVVDDGSTDGTAAALAGHPVEVLRHATNLGYGHALIDAFRYAVAAGYDWVVTMDCDEQHEPDELPAFMAAARLGAADIISGSRYLHPFEGDEPAPAARRSINAAITGELNARLGLRVTDAFCGFKAYRVATLARLSLTEPGYAFPMQLWVHAAVSGARVAELPVRRIYRDLSRSFGGALDDPMVRLAHYRDVLHEEIRRHAAALDAGASYDLAPTE